MSSSREEQTTASSDERHASVTHSAEQTPDDQVARASFNLSSLTQAVKARKADYIRPRTVRIKVGTWNVAAISGTERDVGQWFVEGKEIPYQLSGLDHQETRQGERLGPEETKMESTRGGPEGVGPEDIGIYVLGLQEIVDVSSPSATLRPFADPVPSNRWKESIQVALPAGYQLVAESQLVGLLLLVFAAPNVAPTISSISSTSVGTGLMGYMGNKGATVTRIVLGETTRLVFVNCHLAAGSDKNSLERRNWDASQIVSRTKFGTLDADNEIYGEPSETIGKEEFTFWFGDLNYRLDDIPGEDVRRLLMLHTHNEYDAFRKKKKAIDDLPSPVLVAEHDSDESSSEEIRDSKLPDPELRDSRSSEGPIAMVDNLDLLPDHPSSLQTTLSCLLPHDQLRAQQQKKKAFHEGWREGEIRFLPTYKYDVGSIAMFDSSEKQRGPSWCDRILYRSKQDRLKYEQQVKEAEEARKRDEEMKARGIDTAADDDRVLFDYDPETDGANDHDDYNENDDASKGSARSEGPAESDDPIQLTHYTSHQGILSSDHKPLDAAFTLAYNAVIPELKAKVHQDVVKELDKAENESRPGLTVVIDHHNDGVDDEGKSDIAHDPNALYFGGVSFNMPISRSLTIANTGGVPATFCFTTRPLDGERKEEVTPSWLKIKVDWPVNDKGRDDRRQSGSETHTLAPGDSATVEAAVCIRDIEHVRRLNAGQAKIEDVLLLRVTSGRDHFIPVYGKWLPTCFGRSLQELTHIPESGARSLSLVPPSEAQKMEEGIRLSAPRELFRLTEAISQLVERSVAEWSMTKGEIDGETPPWLIEPHGLGWPFSTETWTLRDPRERAPLLYSVREALDIGSSLKSIFPLEVPSLHRLEIFCETLVSFLRSLKDGIIQPGVWKDMEQQLAERERSKTPWRSPEEIQAWVLDTLAVSPVHSVSFTFLTFMLNQIINEVAPPSNPAALPPPVVPPFSPTTIESRTSSDIPQSPDMSSSTRRQRMRSIGLPSVSSESDGINPLSNPTDLRRQAVEMTLASLFSDLMIGMSVAAPPKEKDRRIWENRKRIVVLAFLQPITAPYRTEDDTESHSNGE